MRDTKKKAGSGNTYRKDPGLTRHLQSISKKVEAWPAWKRKTAFDFIHSRYVRAQPPGVEM